MQKLGSPLKSKSLQYMCDYNIQKDQGQHIFQSFLLVTVKMSFPVPVNIVDYFPCISLIFILFSTGETMRSVPNMWSQSQFLREHVLSEPLFLYFALELHL